MKKVLIVVVLLIVALGAVWFFTSEKGSAKAAKLKPKLSIAAVSIRDIEKDKIKMNMKMILTNPLPVELSSNNLDYSVSINGKKVMEHSYRKPIAIKSNDSSSIELPIDVLLKPLADVLKQLDKDNADSADYTLNASLMLDLPIAGERQFDFNQTVKLPAFQLPELKPKDIDIEKLRWKTSTISVEFSIINPNNFPLKMKDMKYNLTVDKDNAMQGVIDGLTVVPPKSESSVEVLLKIKNKEMPEMMWKALFEKKNTPFAVDVSGELVSKSDLLKDSRFVMRTTGMLNDVKEAAKKL